AEGDRTVPELERVIASVGERVVMANSLQEALEDLTASDLSDVFGGAVVEEPVEDDGDNGAAPVDSGEPSDGDSEVVAGDVAAIVAEIEQLQAGAAGALAEDPADWLEFGRIQARMQELVSALADRAG
ncbi:MAG: hypothetical protein QGI41_07475, partial [Acidimicrobiales bacterium]|nr:hypothetical protein [Acidimicrobiales bacterium]